MELTGNVFAVLPKQEGLSKSGNAWSKIGLVISYMSGTYPQKAVFETMKSGLVDLIASLKEGTEVKCYFNVSASEWNGKWFSKMEVWKIEILGEGNAKTKPKTANAAPATEAEQEPDLPF